MIVKVQGGGGGTYANTGTSEGVINYLQHEDFKRMQEGRKIEHFFSHAEDRVNPQEAISRIDTNRKGLKAKEAKFYVITVARFIVGLLSDRKERYRPAFKIGVTCTFHPNVSLL